VPSQECRAQGSAKEVPVVAQTSQHG